ncbi:MAG TPA: hypothetical protein VLF20_02695, partial [Patescibacteria group bacterium]|nr:hypothetical protein [Patescibacteria group bacterium]
VLVILLFIISIALFSSEQTLRFAPLLMGTTQILLFFVARGIEKHHTKTQTTPVLNPSPDT